MEKWNKKRLLTLENHSIFMVAWSWRFSSYDLGHERLCGKAISYEDNKEAPRGRWLERVLQRIRTQVLKHVTLGHLNDRDVRTNKWDLKFPLINLLQLHFRNRYLWIWLCIVASIVFCFLFLFDLQWENFWTYLLFSMLCCQSGCPWNTE